MTQIKTMIGLFVVVLLSACGGTTPGNTSLGGGTSSTTAPTPTSPPINSTTESYYDDNGCGASGCHDGIDGSIQNYTKSGTRTFNDTSALSDYIKKTMPQSDPSKCVGECASSLAEYLSADKFGLINKGVTVEPTAIAVTADSLFDASCAGCHTSINNYKKLGSDTYTDLSSLIEKIEKTMPVGNVSACDFDCATKIGTALQDQLVTAVTATPEPTATAIPTQSPTATLQPTAISTATATATATATVAPTATAIVTNIPTTSAVPTTAPTATEIPTTAPTATAIPSAVPTATATAAPVTARSLFDASCKGCHIDMDNYQGFNGATAKTYSTLAELIQKIDQTMPLGNAAACDFECATKIGTALESQLVVVPTATPTLVPTSTPTSIPTIIATATPTAIITPTMVITSTPTSVQTPTIMPTATATATPIPTSTSTPTVTVVPTGSVSNSFENGKSEFAKSCALSGCHDAVNPYYIPKNTAKMPGSLGDLALYIQNEMPFGNAQACEGTCANDTAYYIWNSLQTESACAQGESDTAPILRLMTAWEYTNTVNDFFSQAFSKDITAAPMNIDLLALEQGMPLDIKHDGMDNDHHNLVVTGNHVDEYMAASDTVLTRYAANNKFLSCSIGNYVEYPNWPSPDWTGVNYDHAETGDFLIYNDVLFLARTWTQVTPGSDTTIEILRDGTWTEWDNDVSALAERNGLAYRNGKLHKVVGAWNSFEPYTEGAVLGVNDAIIYKGGAWIHVGEPESESVASCLGNFIADVGEKAFRRPLTDTEKTAYLDVIYNSAKDEIIAGDYELGAKLIVQAMLNSPNFLYRSEVGLDSGSLNQYERANALSYLFLASMPDADLFAAAAAGQLASKAQLETQARRLLAKPAARKQVARFAQRWTGADGVLVSNKDSTLYAGFDSNTRVQLLESFDAFVNHVVFDSGDGSFSELLTADYRFTNQTVDAFYGINNSSVADGSFEQSSQGFDKYSGLLTQPAILSQYANAVTSAPVRRGNFVRKRLFCQEILFPEGLMATSEQTNFPEDIHTTRDRFAFHSQREECQACHQWFDGVGFGLEAYDAVGKHRTSEISFTDGSTGHAVDDSGWILDMNQLGAGDNVTFDGVQEMQDLIVTADSAPACFATHYYRFAKGYREQQSDACAVETLQQKFVDSGYDLDALLIEIVKLDSFTQRSAE